MTVRFRRATVADVPAIVGMLADDSLGASREGGDLSLYLAAFAHVEGDPRAIILVGVREGRVVATCQVNLLHGLSNRGSTRAQIEAVRVASDLRGQGIGAALLEAALAEAAARGATMAQLTTNAVRTRAQAFYARLGFTASHVGMKRPLP